MQNGHYAVTFTRFHASPLHRKMDLYRLPIPAQPSRQWPGRLAYNHLLHLASIRFSRATARFPAGIIDLSVTPGFAAVAAEFDARDTAVT
jgi:hypothetical protein